MTFNVMICKMDVLPYVYAVFLSEMKHDKEQFCNMVVEM